MPPNFPPSCPHCGADDIVRGVQVGQSGDSGTVGLDHKKGFLMFGTVPFRADLCRNCGTIVRLYVRETKKNWLVP